MNTAAAVSQLYQKGFCVLPGYFDASDCQAMRDAMDEYWHSQGSPSLAAHEFGFTIHPMMARVPKLAPFLDAPEVIEILSNALQDDARLVHLGARVSGPQSFPRISWHNHYAWDANILPSRTRLERILIGVYVDGTEAEAGLFIASPRKFNDPLGEMLNGQYGEWPNEEKVLAPPGSVAIFDTALWHTAARGTGGTTRRLWGCHFQGWSDARLHPEDNAVDAPEIEDAKREHPRLKAIIEKTLSAI